MDRHRDIGQVPSYSALLSLGLLDLRTPSLQIHCTGFNEGHKSHICVVALFLDWHLNMIQQNHTVLDKIAKCPSNMKYYI